MMYAKVGWVVLVGTTGGRTYYCGHKHLSEDSAGKCARKLGRAGHRVRAIVRSLP